MVQGLHLNVERFFYHRLISSQTPGL